MKIINGSTKKGQSLINSGSKYEGTWLNEVYGTWSLAKQKAWNHCYNKYLATPDCTAFGICSHNTSQFSVSWVGTYKGENAMFLETANNSYVVLLDK